MVINTNRNVGGKVGFFRGIDDVAVFGFRPPASVGKLCGDKPLVGTLGLLKITGDAQSHGAFYMIPRIRLASVRPGNLAVFFLQTCDKTGYPVCLRRLYRLAN
jgi:hypothetical protein